VPGTARGHWGYRGNDNANTTGADLQGVGFVDGQDQTLLHVGLSTNL
jgi:hypothetical protein